MKTKSRIELTPSIGRRRSFTTRWAVASLAPMTEQIVRIKKLMERGFHKPGDVETRLGYCVGQVGR